MTDVETLAALAREIDTTCRLTGTFVLRSGRTADEYFDKYRFEADPRLLDRVAAQLALLVPSRARPLRHRPGRGRSAGARRSRRGAARAPHSD
ncbi:hypothetical protein [Micromonospora zamorensis]|uniref:hypothetical protein n=1 Tax=Micromonospora zamorensis TaxID=709883 RepID=UPI0033A894C4